MSKNVFKVDKNQIIMNLAFMVIILVVCIKIDLYLFWIFLAICTFFLISNYYESFTYEIQIDDDEIVIKTWHLLNQNEINMIPLKSITFIYKNEMVGSGMKAKRMKIFLPEKTIVLSQSYGGWDEKCLEEIEDLLLKKSLNKN
jgi:hypothetical protein